MSGVELNMRNEMNLIRDYVIMTVSAEDFLSKGQTSAAHLRPKLFPRVRAFSPSSPPLPRHIDFS